MKKILLLNAFTMMFFTALSFGQSQKVTLSVDLKEYTGSFNYVGVNGGFKNWGDAIALTNNLGTTIWSVTVDMPKDANNEYRFEINGEGGWHAEDIANTECNVPWDDANQNRNLWIGSDAPDTAEMATVCWNSCTACASLSNNAFELENEISIYPNPSLGGKFTVILPNKSTDIKLNIYNALGQEVLKMKNISGKNFEVNSESLSAGIYYVRIGFESKMVTKKLVIK